MPALTHLWRETEGGERERNGEGEKEGERAAEAIFDTLILYISKKF